MAMEFDGDDHVDTGNTDDLAVWTIACWAKSPAAPSGDSPSGPVHREKNYQFNWNHSNDTFRGSVTVSAGGWHAAKYGAVEADTWYHLAGTYDGEVLTAYKDGVLITANDAPSGAPVAETGTLKLARHATAVQYFTGTVDEAVVYSRVLSLGEIRYLAGLRANLLANGGFEDGVVEPWSVWNGDATGEVVTELVGAAVPEAPIEGDYCLHVVVPTAGPDSWSAGLQHTGHVFEAGKKYTLSAFLKCNQGTLDIRLKPERGADPWEGYGDQVFTMTDTWAEYSITTPVIPADVSPGVIQFHIAFAAGDFWVDDVKWYEVE